MKQFNAKALGLKCLLIFTLFFSFCGNAKGVVSPFRISSPDNKLSVILTIKSGNLYYQIIKDSQKVLKDSRLGLIRDDGDFSENLTFLNADGVREVSDTYELLTIKRKINNYLANKKTFHFKNKDGHPMDIIFQVSNDGVAFRYYFPDSSSEVKHIIQEKTTYHFDMAAKAWMQPMSNAKSGWAKANPSYEEYYQKEIPVGTTSPIAAGWVYPALFHTGKNWVAVTESFPNGDYCVTRLKAESPDGEYSIGLPQSLEVFTNGILGPESKLPWYTPWRVIAIGSLKTIVESTLGTNIAQPAIVEKKVVTKPGISAWSWVLLGDDSTTFSVQKRFIDYAADMHWRYCLIDALWDTKIGYPKMKELADYARTKNVGLLLWYNSAGKWNETPQTPKDKLLTHESRLKEFGILKGMGVKGVKIDFFGGDGQSMIQYYIAILKDAADFGLLVNFHGTTLPRGLERTYPNLVTMEAIKGMEFATFSQANLDEQPMHCTTIPYTRNLFDPMDYTPMALNHVRNLKRATTSCFELALPIIFQSGITHIAETPEGMSTVPFYVKDFLKHLPESWDDIRFIQGYPGKLVVLARRSGKHWYIAGINGEHIAKTLDLDLSFIKRSSGSTMIVDGNQPLSFKKISVTFTNHTKVKVEPYGGFVIDAEQE